MNYWIIGTAILSLAAVASNVVGATVVAAVLSIAAAASGVLGVVQQEKQRAAYESLMENYVQSERGKDMPRLKITGAKLLALGDGKDFESGDMARLEILNYGGKPAKSFSISCTYHPHPFYEGVSYQGGEVANGERVFANMNLIPSRQHDEYLRKAMPQIEWEKYEKFLKDFESGKKPFLANFRLEYKHDDEIKTIDYHVLYPKDIGKLIFGATQ